MDTTTLHSPESAQNNDETQSTELDLNMLADNGIELIEAQGETDDTYLQKLEAELKLEGWQYDGTESETMKIMNDQSKFDEEKTQDEETIISKHTYGGVKEVKLVPVPPPTRENLEKTFSNEEIAEIQAAPQKNAFYIFVRNVEEEKDVEARETTLS